MEQLYFIERDYSLNVFRRKLDIQIGIENEGHLINFKLTMGRMRCDNQPHGTWLEIGLGPIGAWFRLYKECRDKGD